MSAPSKERIADHRRYSTDEEPADMQRNEPFATLCRENGRAVARDLLAALDDANARADAAEAARDEALAALAGLREAAAEYYATRHMMPSAERVEAAARTRPRFEAALATTATLAAAYTARVRAGVLREAVKAAEEPTECGTAHNARLVIVDRLRALADEAEGKR